MYTQSSTQDIAAFFGVSATAVRNRLLKAGGLRCLAEANRVRYRKQIEHLSEDQLQLAYGSLLGDACLYRQVRPTHFTLKIGFAHGEDQLSYLEHKRSVMGGSRISKRPDGSNLGKPVYQFAYSNTQGLLPVEQVVKPDGVRRVTAAWLAKLDERGLAYWYQDDGYLARQKGSYTLRFYTNSESPDEVLAIRAYLTRFGFTSVGTVSGNKPSERVVCCFGREAIVSFLRKLEPYVLPCLTYKLP